MRPSVSAFTPRVHAQGGARGQYLGHHRFHLKSRRRVDGLILYLEYWFSVTQNIDLKLCTVSDLYFMVQ